MSNAKIGHGVQVVTYPSTLHSKSKAYDHKAKGTFNTKSVRSKFPAQKMCCFSNKPKVSSQNKLCSVLAERVVIVNVVLASARDNFNTIVTLYIELHFAFSHVSVRAGNLNSGFFVLKPYRTQLRAAMY